MKRFQIRIILTLLIFSFFSPLFSQTKPDALKLYRQGRDLEAVSRMTDANVCYNQAIDVCKQELIDNPNNMDSYAVLLWSLLRSKQYKEVISYGLAAHKINEFDNRIVEALGEAYFYDRNYKESLRMMEKYIDAMPSGERISTAYFFVGEIYRNSKQYNKADIAYSAAVYHEKNIPLWWLRTAQVREYAGDKINAKIAYEKALQLKPGYQEAIDGIRRTS